MSQDNPTAITAAPVDLCHHCQMHAQGVADVRGFGRLCPDDAKLVELAERRIIEWLRRDAEAWPHSTDGSRVAGMLRNTADRIERGEHR